MKKVRYMWHEGPLGSLYMSALAIIGTFLFIALCGPPILWVLNIVVIPIDWLMGAIWPALRWWWNLFLG